MGGRQRLFVIPVGPFFPSVAQQPRDLIEKEFKLKCSKSAQTASSAGVNASTPAFLLLQAPATFPPAQFYAFSRYLGSEFFQLSVNMVQFMVQTCPNLNRILRTGSLRSGPTFKETGESDLKFGLGFTEYLKELDQTGPRHHYT